MRTALIALTTVLIGLTGCGPDYAKLYKGGVFSEDNAYGIKNTDIHIRVTDEGEPPRTFKPGFKHSNSPQFSTNYDPAALPCTPRNMAGSWRREFDASQAHRGEAIWRFESGGNVVCEGPGCEGSIGVPERHALAIVNWGKPDGNLGINIRYSRGLMRAWCEVTPDLLRVGTGVENGLLFHKVR